MNDKFYKQLIEELPTAYLCIKITCDKYGIPCDCTFIEVNSLFEKLIGLKGTDIVGRKITEIASNARNSLLGWMQFCEDIALNGGKKEYEKFFEFLQRWYKIKIYSPEKYYAVVHFMDITKEKSQLSEMERLIEISEELLQLNDIESTYQKISDDFLKISGAKYAAFNLFEEDGKSFTTKALTGDKGIVKRVSGILGFKLEERKWEYNSALAEKIEKSTITRFHSLRDLVGNEIPKPIIAIIEKTLNIGEVVLIKILIEDLMLGDFTLLMEKGKVFEKDTLAEVYTRQLGMLITRKRAEEALLKEKALTDAIFDSTPGMMYLYDDKNRLVRWNKRHMNITGYSSEELTNISLYDWYKGDEKSQKAIRQGVVRTLKDGFGDAEADLQRKDGRKVPMYFTASSFNFEGKQYFTGIGIDITEQKKRETEIFNLSYYDQLTGLYNRRFYEEELKRIDTEDNLPLTIAIGDVNGLKLVNDSFGHTMGDELLKKVADGVRSGCKEKGIAARLAGDEFAIILPRTDVLEAEQIIKNIKKELAKEKVGSIEVSISFGYDTKNNAEEKIEEIFKKAEDRMYGRKLFEGQSMRGRAIKAIVNTLHEKNKSEEQHSYRVSSLCKRMGEVLELSEHKIKELMLAGSLHDIGKIAIDEDILRKPGELSELEWKELKRHPEIGYRMLNTVDDMNNIANYILYHHERWDGKGYPKGFKGEEIPIVSRIIAIANEYVSLTSDRSFKGAVSEKAAREYLEKNAGTQFDPELTRIFIEEVLGNDCE